jgi:hypothetical protein
MPTATHTAPSFRRTAVLAIILVSYLMIVLDISIVITGLPKIQQGLWGLRGPHTFPRRNDGLLVLHNAVPPRRERLHPA